MEALTINNFKTSKISAVDVDVSENRPKDFSYKSVKFAYNGGEVPPIMVDGSMRSFKFENKNGPVYSLAINCDSNNESFFRKLNSTLAKESCRLLRDKSIVPEDFELVKDNKYGKFISRRDIGKRDWKGWILLR